MEEKRCNRVNKQERREVARSAMIRFVVKAFSLSLSFAFLSSFSPSFTHTNRNDVKKLRDFEIDRGKKNAKRRGESVEFVSIFFFSFFPSLSFLLLHFLPIRSSNVVARCFLRKGGDRAIERSNDREIRTRALEDINV